MTDMNDVDAGVDSQFFGTDKKRTTTRKMKHDDMEIQEEYLRA